MPRNNVTDPVTDQEMAFAHMVLAGTMTDRRAAEAVGLDPGSAAYTKSKPRVREYMLAHRAAVQQRLVEQETEQRRHLQIGRDQILDRLWEIANLSPEMTRGSITGQVKALNMIMALQGLVPDRVPVRRAVSAQKQPAFPPADPEFDAEETTADPGPFPALVEEEDGPQSATEAGLTPSAPADHSSTPHPNPPVPMFVCTPDNGGPVLDRKSFLASAV